jgi:SAM-dependent methyltransferase
MSRDARTNCPACGSLRLRPFYEQDGVPVHSCLLLDDVADARSFPTGELVIALCEECGFVTNTAFRPELESYSQRYEETQGFSAHFQEFAAALAERWIDRYDLRGKRLLEIGCGKGEFLQTICELGGNTGTGIDPSFVPERLDGGDQVTFIPALYDASYGPIDADAVICRHTLEHIAPVRRFMTDVRRGLGETTDTVVLFELPDVRRVLEESAFWDVYYEHCSYFSLGSLARLFRRAGFEVLDLDLAFGDQYLLIEAVPSSVPAPGAPLPVEDDLDVLGKLADGYADAVADKLARWRADVEDACASGRRVAVWGSGSKGVSYLTTLGLGDEISAVVDINPFKHGKFMAGTGHRIVAPEELLPHPPDVVVVMNPAYRGEIRAQLDGMGLHPTLVTV